MIFSYGWAKLERGVLVETIIKLWSPIIPITDSFGGTYGWLFNVVCTVFCSFPAFQKSRVWPPSWELSRWTLPAPVMSFLLLCSFSCRWILWFILFEMGHDSWGVDQESLHGISSSALSYWWRISEGGRLVDIFSVELTIFCQGVWNYGASAMRLPKSTWRGSGR